MKTIEVKTSELEGAALDWAVCYAEASDLIGQPINHQTLDQIIERFTPPFSPSTDWSQGGPLIDRHKVSIVYHNGPDRTPMATTDDLHPHFESGETVLIAACRAIVASKLGDTVQVPADLIGGAA